MASGELSDRQALPTGTKLGPWRIAGFLGRGGMGSVYRATDDATGAEAALKIVSRDVASDPRFVQRFQRETALAAKVVHQNVVACLGSGQANGRLWLALEPVPGGSLADRVAQGPLPWTDVARWGHQIALALAALHHDGIVHRDLKPANVLVDAEGRAKVSDFGLARGQGVGSLTRTGELLGTLEYMAPEMAEGGKVVDGRADLYALGCTLHCLLVGEPPFPGNGPQVIAQHLRTVPASVARRAPGTPPDLARIVDALLAKNPADRGGEAADVARALERIGGEPRKEAPPSPLLRAGVAVLVLAFAAAGVSFLLRRRAETEASQAKPTPTPRPSPTPSPLDPSAPAWFRALDPRPDLPRGIRPREVADEYENAKDHSVLVWVPPATLPPAREGEGERVVSGFFLGKLEVSKDQMAAFCRATGYRTAVARGDARAWASSLSATADGGVRYVEAPGASFEKPDGKTEAAGDRPAVQLTWEDACAYGRWAGLRLPTEAEWERAAGWDGSRARTYPWGAEARPGDASTANVLEVGAEPGLRAVGDARGDRSPVGALQMGGNVAEWVADWFGATPQGGQDPLRLEPAAGSPEVHVVRGGSFRLDWDGARCTARRPAARAADDATGFRVAASAGGLRDWEPVLLAVANGALGEKPVPRIFPPGLRAGDHPGEYVNTADGSVLVYVPAGDNDVGRQPGHTGEDEAPGDEVPVTHVFVSGFFIGKYEVSNAQFERFCQRFPYVTEPERPDTGVVPHVIRQPNDSRFLATTFEYAPAPGASWRKPDGARPFRATDPVVQISWLDAVAYAGWAGLRLPTEAEFERAASWDPRAGKVRKFPWGDDAEDLGDKANFLDLTRPPGEGARLWAVDRGARGESFFGARNMGGNAAEWSLDLWNQWIYMNRHETAKDYGNPGDAKTPHVTRGGSFMHASISLRCCCRGAPGATAGEGCPNDVLGFRVALSEGPQRIWEQIIPKVAPVAPPSPAPTGAPGPR